MDPNTTPEERMKRAINVHKSDMTEIAEHITDHQRGQIDAITAAARIRNRIATARESLAAIEREAARALGIPSEEFSACEAAE